MFCVAYASGDARFPEDSGKKDNKDDAKDRNQLVKITKDHSCEENLQFLEKQMQTFGNKYTVFELIRDRYLDQMSPDEVLDKQDLTRDVRAKCISHPLIYSSIHSHQNSVISSGKIAEPLRPGILSELK